MSAETLRRAASLMRERAQGSDADFIASWHPAVALAVANWLDSSADHADSTGGHCICDDAALEVARAYLWESV